MKLHNTLTTVLAGSTLATCALFGYGALAHLTGNNQLGWQLGTYALATLPGTLSLAYATDPAIIT